MYAIEKVKEEGFKTLIGLCQYLFKKYNISTIKGHRELAPTRCPGLNFSLMEMIQAIFGAYDTYTVKSGDTLWSIAKYYNLTVLRLMELNGLKGSLIYPRQILKIM